jgi:voltage-gated potassium channel
MSSVKQFIFKVLEKGEKRASLNVVFEYFITTLIILNVISIAVESIGDLSKNILFELRIFEIFSVAIFTIEFALRLFISDLTHPGKSKARSMIKFIISPFGLIDLFAILPFYLPFVIKMDLRFLRVLRLIRFFRILKISRYNNTLRLIGSVIKEKRTELGMTLFFAFLLVIISSFLMYNIENPVQPDKFPNVFATIWWAVATLTTIGYGDVYPITGLGKTLSSIISILGIGLIALPTGIISAGFIEKMNKTKQPQRCPHCNMPLD